MLFDRLVALIAVIAALYMGGRGPTRGINDLLPGGRTATLLYLGMAAVVVVTLWQRNRPARGTRVIRRLLCYPLALLLLMIGVNRARTIARAVPTFPPRAAESLATRLDELTPVERAEWGSRVAAHRWADTRSDSLALVIPAAWPFPSDVQVARRRTADGHLEIWARAGDGSAACLTLGLYLTYGSDSLALRTRCETMHEAPSTLVFAPPVRRDLAAADPTTPQPTLATMGDPWEQYRFDAVHTGSTRATGTGTPAVEWRAQVDGPVRASASIVGDLVLIGAHETGALAAFDLTTGIARWSARVPNWVHQDVVSDGRIAVVSFGNVWPSFAGRAPSGVAAYALDSGASLWTVFDESSVMTSGVVRDSVVVYATAAGILKKRSLRTGALIASLQLPGGVIMGPPVATGDTLAAALDRNGLCTVRISTFEMLWCRTIPGLRMVGHSSPTIAGDLVLVSAPGTLRAASLGEFAALPPKRQLELLMGIFGPEERYVGQQVRAFDLGTGAQRWSTPLYPGDADGLQGHSSGTPVIAGRLGVVLLPFADLLVAFEVKSGAVKWTAGGHRARGAPLVVDGTVLVAGRDGVIETRDLQTGALVCAVRHPIGFDRAGPARAGNTLVFAALDGTVLARSLPPFLECTAKD